MLKYSQTDSREATRAGEKTTLSPSFFPRRGLRTLLSRSEIDSPILGQSWLTLARLRPTMSPGGMGSRASSPTRDHAHAHHLDISIGRTALLRRQRNEPAR